jgi:3-hydroxyisobutyrate dehydrogenase-like beta-hydroxyacid dehydrogenase
MPTLETAEMNTEKGKIGVIGLGIIGSAMAANLVKAGFEVIGTDILPEACARLSGLGGKAVKSSAEVGKLCRHIIISVATISSLPAICNELAGVCAKGTIVLETGTLPLVDKQKARATLAERSIILLDCPLSGTGAQAKVKDLAVYASGEAAAIEAIKPVVDGFARVCYNVGEFGNGTKMKFVANLLVAIHNVAAAEALLLAARSGLNPMDVVKIVADGAGGSRMFQVRGPMMATRTWDTEVTMSNKVWQKDMHLIGEALQVAGVPAPLFSACVPIYIAATNGGHSGHDTGAVYEILERMALDPAAKAKS